MAESSAARCVAIGTARRRRSGGERGPFLVAVNQTDKPKHEPSVARLPHEQPRPISRLREPRRDKHRGTAGICQRQRAAGMFFHSELPADHPRRWLSYQWKSPGDSEN